MEFIHVGNYTPLHSYVTMFRVRRLMFNLKKVSCLRDMKTGITLIAAAFVSMLSSCATSESRKARELYDVRFNLGVIGSWRMRPDIIGKECNRVDPTGAARRNAIVETWINDNEPLTTQVENRFVEIVPLVSPSFKNEMAIRSVQALITIEIDKEMVWGKSEQQMLANCEDYFGASFQKNSQEMLPLVRKAMTELDAWKKKRLGS